MAIKILDETGHGDIYLTREQYARYQQEYNNETRSYFGPIPSFEEWVKGKHVGNNLLNESLG
jgi:hypothetical protein